MDLNILWFILITVLFIGFFFLEGFDYGVGALVPILGKDDDERRVEHDRAFLGRQRSLADHCRRRDVRCVPTCLCDDVQRLVSGALPDPAGADPARDWDRIPQSEAKSLLA